MVSGVESYQEIRKLLKVGHKRFPISSSSRESLCTLQHRRQMISPLSRNAVIYSPHQRRSRVISGNPKIVTSRSQAFPNKLFKPRVSLYTAASPSNDLSSVKTPRDILPTPKTVMVLGVEPYQGIRKLSQVGHKRFPTTSSSRESLYTAASPSNDLSSVKTARDIPPHQRRNKDTINKGRLS
ncbi:hypothetical protein CDAR_100061 [Caerostris darwini]|uniref:Uncharacterized protein n=1 Tax=Caerostris darwini TaxID=1538125 RepID=A0AAV4USR2_9ARAC|nr:hypothetical protein CDAR_100061 [Caerostris darwini]